MSVARILRQVLILKFPFVILALGMTGLLRFSAKLEIEKLTVDIQSSKRQK